MTDHTPSPEQSELLPCVCGRKTTRFYADENNWGSELLQVGCISCGVRTGFSITKQGAIELWNTRTPPKAVDGRDVTEGDLAERWHDMLAKIEAGQFAGGDFDELVGWAMKAADEIAHRHATEQSMRERLDKAVAALKEARELVNFAVDDPEMIEQIDDALSEIGEHHERV